METKRLEMEMAFEFWSVGKVIVGVGLMMSSFLGLVIHLTTYKADTDTPTERIIINIRIQSEREECSFFSIIHQSYNINH